MSYELEFPTNSKVHNVFHVSCLKKVLAHNIVLLAKLPPLDDEGKLILVPKAILETREHTLQRRVIGEYLVKWRNFPVEDATWESEQILQHPEMRLLEDKQFQ